MNNNHGSWEKKKKKEQKKRKISLSTVHNIITMMNLWRMTYDTFTCLNTSLKFSQQHPGTQRSEHQNVIEVMADFTLGNCNGKDSFVF